MENMKVKNGFNLAFWVGQLRGCVIQNETFFQTKLKNLYVKHLQNNTKPTTSQNF